MDEGILKFSFRGVKDVRTVRNRACRVCRDTEVDV